MDRRRWLAVSVVLGFGMGCPTEWGMEGFVDRAVTKDMKELRTTRCSEGQREVEDPKCEEKNCPKKCVDD